jgi:phage tail-like protein
MADSTSTITTAYPLPVYNFQVDLGSDSVAFKSASGLSMGFDTVTYRESQTASGKVGPNTFRMPGMKQAVNVTLSKGYVRSTSIKYLYDWISSTQLNVVQKQDITVRLCDQDGNPVVTWTLQNAFPTKLSAPDFNADTNEVAIETLELIGDGLTMAES